MLDAMQDALQRPLNVAAPFRARSKARQRFMDRLTPLSSLGFSVFNSFKTGVGSTVDHLVVGPPGVFVVMSSIAAVNKLTSGIRISGLLKTTRWEARSIARLVSGHHVPVFPVIVAQGDEQEALVRVGDVQIVSEYTLIKALRESPRVLTDQQVLEVASIMWSKAQR